MKKKMLKILGFVSLTTVLMAGCSDKKLTTGEHNVSEEKQTAENESASVEGNPLNPTKSEPKEMISAPEENENRALLPVYRTRQVYGGVLSMLAAAYELPDREIEKQNLYDGIDSMSDNYFAVADVDGDSREELIITYLTSSMAGMFEIVYGYNPDTMELTCELWSFHATTYYDNGIVTVEASHNHSLSMDFWPYDLYQYNPQTDQYDFVADVSAWDKALTDTSYVQGPFPDEVDVDRDGVIYELHTDPDWEGEAILLDEADFNEWISQYMSGAQKLEIEYQPIVSENFQKFTTDHLALLHSIAQEQALVEQTDIGWLYIQNSSLEEAQSYLTQHYAVGWKENAGFEDEQIGSYDGNEVFRLIYFDGGVLSYSGVQVEDVTIFGVYPGMDENAAVASLMSYGFYPKDNLENYMITGDGFGNAAVSYEISNGAITNISVSAYCAYAG
ncbi:MAG: hypothetical protein K2N73_16565 [Lachnospiraceae bacterium]|nr:hypothetical protein [Lachnospiraceae bacterium]